MQPFCLLYRIALLFRGSLISRISRIWNRSRNLFNENLSHCAVTPRGNTNSRNLFNEFLQSSYSRKFRPAKYKRYTVVMLSSLRRLKCTSIIEKGAGFRKFVLYREVFFYCVLYQKFYCTQNLFYPPPSLSLSLPPSTVAEVPTSPLVRPVSPVVVQNSELMYTESWHIHTACVHLSFTKTDRHEVRLSLSLSQQIFM